MQRGYLAYSKTDLMLLLLNRLLLSDMEFH